MSDAAELRSTLEADPELTIKNDSLTDRDEGTIGGESAGAPIPTPEAPMVVVGGRWQCLAPKGCDGAMRRAPFNGPTQAQAKEVGAPINCPECGNVNVIYAGERREKAQEETRT